MDYWIILLWSNNQNVKKKKGKQTAEKQICISSLQPRQNQRAINISTVKHSCDTEKIWVSDAWKQEKKWLSHLQTLIDPHQCRGHRPLLSLWIRGAVVQHRRIYFGSQCTNLPVHNVQGRRIVCTQRDLLNSCIFSFSTIIVFLNPVRIDKVCSIRRSFQSQARLQDLTSYFSNTAVVLWHPCDCDVFLLCFENRVVWCIIFFPLCNHLWNR